MDKTFRLDAPSSLNKFSIVLHKEGNAVYSGTRLSGNVVLKLSQPTEIRELLVRFHGDGGCYWEEEYVDGRGSSRRRKFEGEETYCNLAHSLYSIMLHSTVEQSHPAGRYSYPFSFDLPPDLPSSFEGKFGHVRYVLEAEIYLPRHVTPKVEKNVTVRERIDSNLVKYRNGPGGEEEKGIGCLCCVAGRVAVRANIDRGCYCPGESAYVDAKVENHTTREMGHMVVKDQMPVIGVVGLW